MFSAVQPSLSHARTHTRTYVHTHTRARARVFSAGLASRRVNCVTEINIKYHFKIDVMDLQDLDGHTE